METPEKHKCGHLAVDGRGHCESCFAYVPHLPPGYKVAPPRPPMSQEEREECYERADLVIEVMNSHTEIGSA